MRLTLVGGDILDARTVRQAARGCDWVVHCAVESRRTGRPHRRSIVDGTRHVLQAALEAGARRVVVLSSVGVFGRVPPPGLVTEESPLRWTRNDYGDAKIRAERIALAYARRHGLPVAILRPTIVYGPFSRYWTVDTALAIRRRQMVLVNGGVGTCNALYVDNLVDAVFAAAEHPRAPGEIFHVSDAAPITWRAFIEGHARALGTEYLPLPELTLEEYEALRARAGRQTPSPWRRSLAALRDPALRRALRSVPAVAWVEGAGRVLVRNVLPEAVERALRRRLGRLLIPDAGRTGGTASSPPLLPRSLVQLYAARTVFPIDKARHVLGYAPAIPFDEGMRRTAAWMAWARL